MRRRRDMIGSRMEGSRNGTESVKVGAASR
jgi:hypothetical protein